VPIAKALGADADILRRRRECVLLFNDEPDGISLEILRKPSPLRP
jgi:hypothetical protein